MAGGRWKHIIYSGSVMLAPFAVDKHWALATSVLKHCVEFFGRN
jgi:hypothetical protein